LSLKSLIPAKPEKRLRLKKSRLNKPNPTIVYLGLGSNWGARERFLSKARRFLEKNRIRIIKQSSIYETEPMGFRQQPRFLNQVIEVSTKLTPKGLLNIIKDIENKMGRIRLFINGPRIIDIDILFYNNHVMDTPALTIPHPRINQRAFVLVPLAEIAPRLIHPQAGIPILDILKGTDPKGIRKWL